MPLKEIKKYLQLADNGIGTAEQRRSMMVHQKQRVLDEIASLQKSMRVIDRKIKFYDEAVKKQTLNVCQDDRKEWLDNILAGKEKVQ